MRSCTDESLLRRPPTKDSARPRTWGLHKAQAARLFDVSLSSVKRYASKAQQGHSLAPKKASGRPPKLDENAGKLLEGDTKERPAATIEQRRRFLGHLTGKTLSNSTVRRLLKCLGFSRKKGLWGRWSEMNS